MNLTSKLKFLVAADAVAVGVDAAEVLSSALKTEGVKATILVKLGSTVTNAGTLTVKVYEGVAADSNFEEVAGYEKTITFGEDDAKKVIVLDLPWVQTPYIKVGYKRAVQNSIIDSILVFAYEGRIIPPEQDSSIVKVAAVLSR